MKLNLIGTYNIVKELPCVSEGEVILAVHVWTDKWGDDNAEIGVYEPEDIEPYGFAVVPSDIVKQVESGGYFDNSPTEESVQAILY